MACLRVSRMKLSGSTFFWLAGLGFVWAMGPARAAGSEPGTPNPHRFDGSVRPAETFRTSGNALRLLHGRSGEYRCFAPGVLRPDQRRVESFARGCSPVERVRIGRTPELHRAGAVSLNRFVFRRTAGEGSGR